MEGNSTSKSEIAKREERVLAFWKKNHTFEKSEEKEAPQGEFIFYDGPPFATGLPHHGSLLSSIIKDVVPRYKTMRGFRVKRRWGWDCHGLPIENLVEKKLGLKTKKDIEKIGVATFNAEARASVMQFAHDWELYIDRIGRWVDFKHAYKTMDTSYIESVWYALSRMNKKGLLYEGQRVLMYCPHCETPLAKAEIAADNTYKDITEEAVTVKFKITNTKKYNLPDNTYVLAWTTTPWTLPGNVGLAVGPDIDYTLVYRGKREQEGLNFTETGGSHYIVATNLVESLFGGGERSYSSERTMKGNELVGLTYEPLYEIAPVMAHKGKHHVVLPADFVSTQEGTGIVHTAVMYGEDDFALGSKEGLPMVQLLTPSATYNELSPSFLRGRYIKEAEKDITNDLETRGLLFARAQHTHSYPHCWRCGTPLIYNAVSSWFINIQKIKSKMLAENEKITWVPEHLKHGRFKNIVESAPDWTISRNRYWASPLPIWKKQNGDVRVIGTVKELLSLTKKSGNTYFLMRHGLAQATVEGIDNGDPSKSNPLTEEGRAQVQKSADELKEKKITRIMCSPMPRAKETAEIVRQTLGLLNEAVAVDERLSEVSFGTFEGKPTVQRLAHYADFAQRFTSPVGGEESYSAVRKRVMEALFDYENKYTDTQILIVGHGGPLWLMREGAKRMSEEEMAAVAERRDYLDVAAWSEMPFTPFPHDEQYRFDLHRPYIDEFPLRDESGAEMKRIPEVIDCWVESGTMPFAQHGYHGEPLEQFDPIGGFLRVRKGYPADFIAEYIAQTRTWFYYMHAVAIAMFRKRSFKTVVSTGNILASDGSKMSKSKGNYTDPLLLLDRYGADAYRFYLMSSVVMQSEDIQFRDEDIRDIHNRVVGMLWNCYKFFELYKHEVDETISGKGSSHVLDRWMYARLNETAQTVTEALDSYDTPRACRSLRECIEDYSTWYLRRSRERVKGSDAEDKKFALAVQREALITISKLIAPIMPFMAEDIYQKIVGEEQSVHLSTWPAAGSVSKDVLVDMKKARTIVSAGLEARAKAGIKVRQPLSALRAKESVGKEYASIIEEELNVKKFISDQTLSESVTLDTSITEELRKEGDYREFARAVQDFRKKLGLRPQDRIIINIKAELPVRETLERFITEIQTQTGADDIRFEQNIDGDEVQLDAGSAYVAVAKV